MTIINLSYVAGAIRSGLFLLGLAWLGWRTLGVITGMGLGHARSLTAYGHDTTIYTLLLYRLFPHFLLLFGWACYVRRWIVYF